MKGMIAYDSIFEYYRLLNINTMLILYNIEMFEYILRPFTCDVEMSSETLGDK